MTKIEGVPDGYELVRIGSPKKYEAFIVACSNVGHAPHDFSGGGYAIVRKIEPPKPIEPPQGYRLLVEGEEIGECDMFFFQDKYWDDVMTEARHSVGQQWSASRNVPFARKVEVRPVTRAEFLAAWKQRGFCPLIDPETDIDVVLTVAEETEFDADCVYLNNAGWCSMDELADYKFASDETYLTVEE